MLALDYSTIRCNNCQLRLPVYEAGSHDITCKGCRTVNHVYAYPALWVKPVDAPTQTLQAGSEQASCFYHEENLADVACDYCGRFICSLCAIDMGQKILCPGCIEKSDQHEMDSDDVDLLKSYIRYDRKALQMSLIPLGVTAFVALYYIFRYCTKPVSMLSKPKLTWVFATLFALAQLAGIALLCWFIWS